MAGKREGDNGGPELTPEALPINPMGLLGLVLALTATGAVVVQANPEVLEKIGETSEETLSGVIELLKRFAESSSY